MSSNGSLVDHETSLVFANAVKKRVATISQSIRMETQQASRDEEQLARHLQELTALQQQTVNLCLARLRRLQNQVV